MASRECVGSPPFPPRRSAASYYVITRNFTAAILHGEPLIAPGLEGIRGLTLSNAMHLSTWTDDWVELPLDEQRYFALLQERIAASVDKNVASRTLDAAGSWQR